MFHTYGHETIRHATYRPKPGPLSQRLQKCASAIDSAVFALQITSKMAFEVDIVISV